MARGGYRPGAGRPKGKKSEKGGKPTKARPKQAKKNPEIPSDIVAEAAAENMLPLDYMLKVMRDPEADLARRDRMATAAAPFVHPRKGEGAGKKEDKEERAKKAGSGRFAPAAPPLKVVK